MKFWLLVLCCLCPMLVHAHDLWIEREGNRLTLQQGHLPGGHVGAEHLDYRPASVVEARCMDGQGQSLGEAVRGYPVTLEGDCALGWFRMSNYWSRTPYGTRNLPRDEVEQVLDSWLALESVKRLDTWGAALASPLGQSLELVPLQDPLRMKVGAKLRVAVFREGQPQAGVTVAYFGQPRGVTDVAGALNIRLRQSGLQLIQASSTRPLANGKADRVIESTTLQFELAP